MIKKSADSYQYREFNSNIAFKLIYILSLVFSIFISLYIFLNNDNYEFRLLWMLPMAYVLLSILFMFDTLSIKKYVFLIVYWVISFARFVILPLFILIGKYYGGRSTVPLEQYSIDKAILLMCFELFVSYSFIYLLFFSKKTKLHNNQKNVNNQRNSIDSIQFSKYNFVYSLFAIFIITLIIYNPNSISNINFIFPNENFERSFSSEGLLYAMAVYGILILKNLFFLYLLYILAKINQRKPSNIWFIIAIMMAILNTSIYYGASRSDIIINGIVSIIAVFMCFPKQRRVPVIFIFIVFISLVVSGITIGRQIDYSNYVDFYHFADLLSIYLGGPYNVAIAIETPIFFPESSSLSILMFDIFRPIIGIGYFFKNLPYQYSVYYFNYRIFFGSYHTQLLPMIGQGYIFLGFLFSPLFEIIFIYIAYILTKISYKSTNLEVKFFLLLVCVRLGFMMGQSGVNQINSMSLNLLLFMLLYLANKNLPIRLRKLS